MKWTKNTLALLAIVAMLVSCARSVTVQQAANNHYKKCRALR